MSSIPPLALPPLHADEEPRRLVLPGADDQRWPTLDEKALHGVVGEVVGTIAPHTEADNAALLVDLLTSAGNSINSGPHVIADGAKHTARIFAAIVGATSKGRKGTTRNNNARVMVHADPEWAESRVLGGLASGEGLIAAVADPEVDDHGKVVSGSRDRRALVVEEELVRVLKVATRDGNTLSAIMRQAWDNGNLAVMTRKEPLRATGAHISIISHVTLEEFRRTLTDTDAVNGFANRFLIVLARRSKLLPRGGDLQESDFGRLGRLMRSRIEDARKIHRVTRSPRAELLWEHIYEELAFKEASGLVGAITARAEAQVLRLSLLYALLDKSSVIEVEHLEAAWALWKYASASVEYIFGDSTGDEIADRLVEELVRVGADGLDGSQQRDLFQRHVKAQRLDTARELLHRTGKAVTFDVPTGGRPRSIMFASAYAPKAMKATKGWQ